MIVYRIFRAEFSLKKTNHLAKPVKLKEKCFLLYYSKIALNYTPAMKIRNVASSLRFL